VTVLRKRERQIMFRVSDEEYKALREACLEIGARSMSELAREAVTNFVLVRGGGLRDCSAEMSSLWLNGRVRKVEEALGSVADDIREIKNRVGVPPRR
jgi:hypothetical protein